MVPKVFGIVKVVVSIGETNYPLAPYSLVIPISAVIGTP